MQRVRGLWLILKEIGRHVLRRPVVGVLIVARTEQGQWLLLRRGDTGQWAMPGGTLEWGETLRQAATRELAEETGARVLSLGRLLGVYSAPDRDFRFHAVTVVVEATVTAPTASPHNPLEVREVRLFAEHDLPDQLSHSTLDMLRNAQRSELTWE